MPVSTREWIASEIAELPENAAVANFEIAIREVAGDRRDDRDAGVACHRPRYSATGVSGSRPSRLIRVE